MKLYYCVLSYSFFYLYGLSINDISILYFIVIKEEIFECCSLFDLNSILGDEGSGAHLGRTLVADLLKNQLTDSLKEMFFSEFKTDRDQILTNVYRKPEANRYLASLSVFLCRHIEEPECYNMVYKCFSDFFVRNIMQYDAVNGCKISFTGSVAENYKDVLLHVCEHYGVALGKIETNPIAGLVKYHLNSL